MAVVQYTEGKVRPVMDYKELNEHVDAFTADVDICTAKLMAWHEAYKYDTSVFMSKKITTLQSGVTILSRE